MLVGSDVCNLRRFEEAFRVTLMPPLADKAAIVRNDSLIFRSIYSERTLHVPGCRSGKDIKPVVLTFRKSQGISFALYGILYRTIGQIEFNTSVSQGFRNQFSRI